MVYASNNVAHGAYDFECYDELTAEVMGVECSITIYVHTGQDGSAMLEVSVAYKPDGADGDYYEVTRSSPKPYTDEDDEAKPWESWLEYQKLKEKCGRLLLADKNNDLFHVAVERAAIDAASGQGFQSVRVRL